MSNRILAYASAIILAVACSSPPQQPTLQATNTLTLTPSPIPTSTPTYTITPTPTPLPMAGPVTEDVMTRLGKGWVNDLTFSPNGKVLSVATSIGVYLYQVESMELISFLPSKGFVKDAVFINDETLVMGSSDGSTTVWDIDGTSKALETLQRNDPVVALGVSEENTILVVELGGSGTSDGVSVINWDRINPENVNKVSSEYVFNGEYSSAKNILALGTWMQNIILVDTQKMRTTATICRKCGAFALSQNGDLLATDKWLGGDKTQMVLLDTISQKEIANFKEGFTPLSFSPDGKLLVSNSTTGLDLWNVETAELVNTFDGERALTAAFSSDGLLLAFASSGGDLILRDLTSVDIHFIVRGFTPISQAVFQNEHIASTIGMNFSSVLDKAGGGEIPTSYFLANRDTIVLRDISTAEIIRTFLPSEENSEVISFTFSPDGKAIASTWHIAKNKNYGASENYVIIFFDVNTGEQLKSLNGFDPIAISPDNSMLAASATENQLVIWDITSAGTLPLSLGLVPENSGKPYKNSIVFSPDGSMIAILSDRLILRNTSTGEQLKVFSNFDAIPTSRSFERGGVGVVGEFSPNGQILASSSLLATSESRLDWKPKGIVILWEVASGEKMFVLEGHTEPITSIKHSPDGTVLATGAKDKTIRLWDTQSGNLVKILRGHTGPINSLSFSPDGRLLYSNAFDGTVTVWNLEQLIP